MKHTLYIIIATALFFGSQAASACTNLIVGKKASVDGSVIVSYNADSYGMYGNLYRHVGGTHLKGEKRKVYDWDTNKYLGEIAQAERTYNVVGQMNENQVSICETTFGGREELADPNGGIDYGSLIYIALERSTSARNAIKIMTDLVAEYGYFSEGETFTIADKDEVWIMEMIGKGPDNKGAVWAAVRIPDDCISAHANQSRITRLSQFPKQDVMYSKDVIKFAREKGYFTGKDADFSFRDAYNPLDFGGIRYCDARAWSFFNRFAEGDMSQYMPYINADDMSGEMPLYMKPKRPLSVTDVMAGMRDHYEGTPLDITKDLGAGPYVMPYRPSPLSFKIDDQEYFNERPISTQQTGFSFVGQMRSWMPDAIGGIVWWTNDDANMAPYTPIYCGVSEVPQCYQRIEGKQDETTFSWQSAFWLENLVANMVYPYYSKMFPDLLAARDNYEQDALGFIGSEAERQMGQAADRQTQITRRSLACADKMMKEWEQLFRFITVKHNDMVVKKVDTNGKFVKTEYGYAASPVRPGYPEEFNKRVVKETGNRYKTK